VIDTPARLLAANARFADGFGAGALPRPPARRLVVLTCMDARIDPLSALGLELGDAHVLRNAGAVATDDVIRSLTISTRLLGTREVAVIGHTDCGMVDFTNEQIHGRLAEEGVDASDVEFYPFADVESSVRRSVSRIRESPLVVKGLEAHGFLYEVESGRLRQLP
jgi:carbonic anhydrase